MKKRLSNKRKQQIYRRRRVAVMLVVLFATSIIAYGGYSLFFSEKDPITLQEENTPSQNQRIDDAITPEVSLVETDSIKPEAKPMDSQDTKETEENPQEAPITETPTEKQEGIEVSDTPIEGESAENDMWNLILANEENPLPKNFVVNKAAVQGNYQADTRIIDPAQQMFADAKAAGIDLLVCSAFRSIERQENLFNNSIEGYKAQGYNDEDALKFTKAWYAIPGTSEHHTGLALDIVTPTHQVLDEAYAQTDAAKWLLANGQNYGFILRYPKDKEEITGISFEPWHYRYVGIDVAKEIKQQGLCLEEYLGKA